MVPRAFVRQYAVGQAIDEAVADQEIVLHYALTLLEDAGLVTPETGEGVAGPLLFKGGTALRKCVFGSTGRFSQDIDLDATQEEFYEAEIEAVFAERSPYHGIEFTIPGFRHSEQGNFSDTVEYRHANGSGRFELQISYRMTPVLDARPLHIEDQTYLNHVECGVPTLFGLDPYEMIGEKIMACSRRGIGGSSKDVYDLFLWAHRPFDDQLVRRLAVLKAWTDQRDKPRFDPASLVPTIVPASFRWTDISRLVPRKHGSNHEEICRRVRERFCFLTECSELELELLDDQTAHREQGLFETLRKEAREWAAAR